MNGDVKAQILTGVWLTGMVLPACFGFERVSTFFWGGFILVGSLILLLSLLGLLSRQQELDDF